jgi:hypothetical protein
MPVFQDVVARFQAAPASMFVGHAGNLPPDVLAPIVELRVSYRTPRTAAETAPLHLPTSRSQFPLGELPLWFEDNSEWSIETSAFDPEIVDAVFGNVRHFVDFNSNHLRAIPLW